MKIFERIRGIKRNHVFKIRPFFAVYSVIIASLAYLLSVSWLKWGNLIIDTSRELWVPYKILKGAVLYKDISYSFGFFVPYFVGFLYKFFGVNLYVLVWLGITTTILMSIVMYKICRLFLNELTSGLAILTFLFVFAFGSYTYSAIFNFILPYSFSSTIFILFISLALYYFFKFILFEKEKDLFVWSIFLSLAFFCRPESSFPVWVGFALIMAVIVIKEKHRTYLKMATYTLLPLIIALSGYLIFLWKNSAFAGFKESVIDLVKFEIFNSEYTRNMAGTNSLFKNSILMFCSFISHIIVISLLAAGSLLISRYRLNRKRIDIYAGFIMLLIVVIIYQNFVQKFPLTFMDMQYRCIPIILAIGISLFSVRAIRNPLSFKGDISLLTLFVISFLIILRILFKTNPLKYGFYLLNPGLICYLIFFLKIFKDFLVRRMKMPKDLFQALLIIFFAFLMIPYWLTSSRLYELKALKIMTNRGDIIYWPNIMTVRFCETDKYLLENTARDDKVVVFPEGASINFFSGRDNPLKYYQFLPFDLERIGEDKIISQLISYNVKYVVIVNRPADDYVYPWFGVHYGKKLSSWIYNNYDIVKELGPRPFTGTDEFGIVILRKKINK